MSDDFSRQLDALMAQARADFQNEHAAMVEVARMFKRYADAKGELLDVAAYLAERRQPLAQQAHQNYQPVPGHHLNADHQMAEQQVAEEWDRIKRGAM